MEQRKYEMWDSSVLPGLDLSLGASSTTWSTPSADPRLPDIIPFAWVRRACEAAIHAGAYQQAWRGAQALMRRCPEALAPSMLMARVLLLSNKPGLALPHFQLLLKRNATDSAAWAGLATALTQLGRVQAGISTMQRSILNQPLQEGGVPSEAAAALPLALGVIYLRRGMADMAAVELAKSIQSTTPRDDLQWYYIEALRQSGRIDEARRLLAHHDFEPQPQLPLLILRALLSTAPDVLDATFELIHAMDPDGNYSRLFFAPKPVPWSPAEQPMVGWDQDIVGLSEYLLQVAPQFAQEQTSVAKGNAEPTPASSRPAVIPGSTLGSVLQRRGADPKVFDGQIHMLLANRSALVRRFGMAASKQIDQSIQQLSQVLRQQGMTVCAGYIDDPVDLAVGDIRVNQPVATDAMAIRDMVRIFAERLQTRGLEVATLLLIGGDDCIPFHRLHNPIPDDEKTLLSDNPYACDDSGYLIPQRIVARIPTGDDNDPRLLLTILHTMTSYHASAHHEGRLGFDLGAWLRIRNADGNDLARGIAAEVWHAPSREILHKQLTKRMLSDHEVLYINLHGASGMPHFYGQAENSWGAATALPIAITPDHMSVSTVGGTILLSEACYGAELLGRTTENSIPLRALSNGALAFVGSTVNAYGSAQTPLLGADLLFERLTHHMAHGLPVGLALHFARLEFAQTMYDRQGFLDDVDMKTLIEFILLGDPWVALKGNQAHASIKHSTESGSMQLMAVSRVPKVLRHMILQESDIPADMLSRAKATLQKFVDPKSAQLSIVATTNPRYQAKGITVPDVRFSMKSMVQTSDGLWLPRNAHVTMSNQSLTKMVLSR
ncbi:MAG: hypothetical protein RI985_506 [Chloroflexota bacterium]